MSEREPPAIHIPAEVVEAEAVPDDLDSSDLGPWEFPSPKRRRLSGWVYLAGGLLAAAGAVADLPPAMWLVAGGFSALAAWHFSTSWPLNVSDDQALAIAARSVSFPVGHSSGAVRFEGVRSKPVWNVLLYAADEPPSKRALVLIDGVTGDLRMDPFEEELVAGNR